MNSVNDIKEKVHKLYWANQGNCAYAMLICMSELMKIKLDPQVLSSVAGLHGAEKFGAQCGLVIAGQMFISIYYRQAKIDDATIVLSCAQYAEAFRSKFATLVCSELRLNGYMSQDPRHTCEQLTCDAVTTTYNFLKKGN